MPGKRQPIDLILHKGKKNLTKQEIEERRAQEIKAPTDNIEPPSYLNTKKLKEKFNNLADELKRIEIMSNLDTDALARFVFAQDMYEKLTKQLSKIKPIIKDEAGNLIENEVYSKSLINQDKLFKQCRQAASDLGLTISSRCKLVVPKPPEEKPDNKFSKFAK
jgi:P27 family predicted phage terminase small subunit